jgi:iron complex outermembrane receptor protein
MIKNSPWPRQFGIALLCAGVCQPLAAQEKDDDPEVTVTASRVQKLYRVETTATGRLPTEPLESSQSIQVINSELIEDQGARTAQDLYRNISSVTFFSYAGVTARGFRQEEIFFDGLRGDPYIGFSVPQLFNVQRVEFLKGPAGMLYGQSAPGGLFNYSTKVPQNRFLFETKVVAGNQSRRGASFDLNAPIGSGENGARAGVFYEDRDLPRHGAGNETLIADGGVTLALTDSSRLILQATRYDQDLAANRLRGVPVDNAGNFLADREWNHNEPTDFLDLRSDVLQARLASQPNDALSFDLGVRYNDAEEKQQYHEPFGLFDSNNDGVIDASRRQFRDQLRNQRSWSVGANAIWSKAFGAVTNRVLAGVDWFDQEADLHNRNVAGRTTPAPGLPSPLSLINPVYGQSDSATYVLPASTISVTSGQRQGAYLLEEATVGRFIATLGVRFDEFDDESGAVTFDDSAVSWRAGLVYRMRDDLSAYAQTATSFEPQAVTAQDPLAGGPFNPTDGKMYELGLKWEPAGGRVQASTAIYHIVRSNVLQSDPRGDVNGDGVNDSVAFGEVTSKGVEVDVAADLTRNWVLTLSYAYNDTAITRDNGLTVITNSVGDRFANAPRNHAGFWTRYQFPGIGLALAFGGDYVDVRRSISGQIVQPYFIADASIIWERGPWSALLRTNNLFDETYAASGFIDRTGHFPGAPREVFVELGRKW